MERRLAATAVGLALLLAGCAKVSGAGAGSPAAATGPSSVVPIRAYIVGADKSGQMLMIHIGQELVVNLGPTFAVPPADDPRLGYPKGLLAFTAKGAPMGKYVFEGRKLGTGRIWILAPGCRPGPVMGSSTDGVRCPVVRPASGSEGSNSLPQWIFTATVKVMPLGPA
jgi:hypothetical protein